MSENCYFWLDLEVPEAVRTMSIFCIQCHDEKYRNVGWLWEGSKKGYGPFDYKCTICGKMIHKGSNE
jgi:hypothetical protein